VKDHRLEVLSPREASIFACLVDAMLAPEPDLPPVAQTSAVQSFDQWLARSPSLNRTGLRAALYLAEVLPLAMGRGARLRRLERGQRTRFVADAERRAPSAVRLLFTSLRVFAAFNYYGDDQISRRLGFDADAVVARGRELRRAEGRP
jgi:hypothetical protein